MLTLATKADVKARVSELQDTVDDSLLDAYLASASAQAEKILGRLLTTEERTKDFEVREGQRIFALPAYPVDTGETITVKLDSDRAFGAETALDATDFHVEAESGLLELWGMPNAAGPGILRVTWTGGMAANDAAFQAAFPDIRGAVADQVAFMYRRRNVTGLASKGTGGASVQISAMDWLESARAVLELHRRLVW